ncbi:MAG: methyltransferase domain-containing protein [Phycisphaerales bacterium]|nr:methyltransferase domain-containing protein [Phycisphaerales bacterium]
MNYIMETSSEGLRIERKTDRMLTIEQLRWAGIRNGASVLDLGCAAGTTCRIMAGLVGRTGRVVGVDASHKRVEEGRAHADHRQTIEYRQGFAEEIPAGKGEFDIVWSRFLFEYLAEPQKVLAEMMRVTKPGGTVCVSDLDGNCIWHHPCEASLQKEIDAALATLAGGFKPRIGLSLFSLFVDAGLQDLSVDVRPYHVIAGGIDADREEHWRMKLEGVCNALTVRGWSPIRAISLSTRFMSLLRDSRSFTYSVLITMRGTVMSVK